MATRVPPLLKLAQDAEDVASGLHTFRDNLPRQTAQFTDIISKLFAISSVLQEIDRAQSDPRYQPSSYRIHDDIGKGYASLRRTLDDVFDVFGRSRDVPKQIAWDDLQHRMTYDEGLSLNERSQYYKDFFTAQLDVVHGYQPPGLRGLRMRIMSLTDAQEVSALRPERLTIRDSEPNTPRPRPRRPPMPRMPTSPTSFSDEWDYERPLGPPPVAPEVPPFGVPLSPTSTSNSSQSLGSTQTSYSSGPYYPPAPPPQLVHWAEGIFNGQHDRTPFRAESQNDERGACFGTADPQALHHLSGDRFQRVLELPFDRERLWMRLYWRPPDKRARILVMTRDAAGRELHYSQPLSNLKVIRDRSSLQLCRARQNGEYTVWARLNFMLYERMALFYCTFVAMKHQDTRGTPRHDLIDLFELKGQREEYEYELFGGKIKHGGMRHALRLFRDRTSGVVRLEACALRGPMQDVPIWTAFVSRYAGDPAWAEYQGHGLVSLAVIRPPPYVFLSGFEPLRRGSEEYLLQFDSSDDAKEFVGSWEQLCRTSPYR